MSYQNSSESMDLTAQSIFGGIGIKGNLPVSTKHFVLHSGLRTNRVRLKYSMPEEFGVTETDLYKIDSLINDAILKKATPGCQILIAKKGKVVFQRSYLIKKFWNTLLVSMLSFIFKTKDLVSASIFFS